MVQQIYICIFSFIGFEISVVLGDEDKGAKSRAGNVHFTMIFNVFVLMTLFNEINARYVNNFFHSFVKLQKGY